MTCLSADDHGHLVKDVLLHYLGCVEIGDRKRFFDNSYPLWKSIIEEELRHGANREETMKMIATKKEDWKKDCDREIRRIDFLRKTLLRDNHDRHLVKKLAESSADWRKSEEYKTNVPLIRKWRRRNNTAHFDDEPDSPAAVEEDEEVEEYVPEKDVTVPFIQFENGKGVSEKDERVWNTFPNQKTNISRLVNEGDPKDSLLFQKRPGSDGKIQYFHLHSNNNLWAQQAIARYYGEEDPDCSRSHQGLIRKNSKASMILRPAYWRSQVSGGHQTAAHPRHMRPLCAVVSSEPESNPDNIVLFMPYLHWETSRQRELFATEIENIIADAKADTAQKERKEKRKRQAMRRSISKLDSQTRPAPTPKTPFSTRMSSYIKESLGVAKPLPDVNLARAPTDLSSMDKVVEVLKLRRKLKVEAHGRLIANSSLGQYLLDAARLYEGMANYRDKSLLRKYLPCNPPQIQPRRTLDQSYYWTLKSTRFRDSDQVVYRATTAKFESFHQYEWDDDKNEGKWPAHEKFEIREECQDCKANIQKLSRVIMVDQLWMWILDRKTIITCFPKRYGTNKQDSSGVHKSIRTRLEDNTTEQIRSVFDLALIIIDECSNTFFNRTKTSDLQPQLIDEFSNAIGNIMHRQSAAFDRLWHWTEDAKKVYKQRGSFDSIDISQLHVPLLDINPEGKLEREIKDIVEELDIMIHITKTYEDVLKNFVANVEDFLDPSGEWRKANRTFWRRQCHKGRGGGGWGGGWGGGGGGGGWGRSWSKGEGGGGGEERGSENRERRGGFRGDHGGERRGDGGGERRHGSWGPNPGGADDKKQSEDEDGLRIYSCFKLNADDRLADAKARVEKLEELRSTALSTAENVKTLLELKQQQASVVQAWQACQQSDESVRQGRAIMMFTVVTIIFLPLSFMSSVFGMNNVQLTGDSWEISDEFKYMFPISAGVIFISLFLAFGTWIRAAIWYLYKIPLTYLLIHSGLYKAWLTVGCRSGDIYQQGAKWMGEHMVEVRKARFEQRREEREYRETRDREKKERENRAEQARASSNRSASSSQTYAAESDMV
ncbi:hypothetical protein GGR52DRAFT_309312 [Hypoxylon sp. FL1284]|nr:hypothetical protein GGR52DRAFT_309312 [Hypoxylon sp. FL1284]